MCGRYSLKKNPNEFLKDYFPGIQFDPMATFAANEDVRPTQNVSAVISVKGASFHTFMRWGLIPSWTQDVKPKHSFINARSESVSTKPAFKASYRRKRCIIPADSFYEWQQSPTRGKIPLRFSVENEPLLLLAGLWDQYEGPIGVIQGFVILTTSANRSISDVHDRMPVVLNRSTAREWLATKEDDADGLQKLFLPERQPALKREEVPGNLFGSNSPQFELPF